VFPSQGSSCLATPGHVLRGRAKCFNPAGIGKTFGNAPEITWFCTENSEDPFSRQCHCLARIKANPTKSNQIKPGGVGSGQWRGVSGLRTMEPPHPDPLLHKCVEEREMCRQTGRCGWPVASTAHLLSNRVKPSQTLVGPVGPNQTAAMSSKFKVQSSTPC